MEALIASLLHELLQGIVILLSLDPTSFLLIIDLLPILHVLQSDTVLLNTRHLVQDEGLRPLNCSHIHLNSVDMALLLGQSVKCQLKMSMDRPKKTTSWFLRVIQVRLVLWSHHLKLQLFLRNWEHDLVKGIVEMSSHHHPVL
jgi:hypothetical protein